MRPRSVPPAPERLTGSSLATILERLSPGGWELYRKTGETRESELTGARRSEHWRQEEGWAARWWKEGMRFASGSDRERLAGAVELASRLPALEEPLPALPAREALRPESETALGTPPQLFDRLSQLVSEKSRGEAVLASCSLRRGRAVEDIVNGRGLAVRTESELFDGVARARGRRGRQAREARAVFRWDGEPDLESLAARLADAATFPLAARGLAFPRGDWLLDPSVAAMIVAGIAPLFTAETLPRWIKRSEFASRRLTIADDASADAAFDGEGTPTRRVVLVGEGVLAGRLHDLRSASRAGEAATGHGVRPSYRVPPRPGARRLFIESSRGTSPRELLAAVARGVFARAVTSPISIDLERDRYEIEFTGVAVLAGRASEPIAGARVSGRISELLSRISGVGTDRQFFPLPYPVGAPTLLVERVNFS